MKKRVENIAVCAVVAALYAVLTAATWSFAGGAVQCRLSEALCVLPLFFPSSVFGITLGCFLSNLFCGALWQDVVFGTLATFVGAVGAYLLRRHPNLAPLPTVLANTAVLPFVFAYAYHMETALSLMFLSVFAGEFISAYVLGLILYHGLKRTDLGGRSL